ncbi:MAG: hypothetical protein LVR00_07670 [Rhabdochlamydiaceae bacterium]|jgi:type II secretory pathway component GspD/PulD (secretin)
MERQSEEHYIKKPFRIQHSYGQRSRGRSFFEEPMSLERGCAHHLFQEVPVIEFIRFVSRISHENFIFDDKELGFNISLSSGKPVSSSQVLQALVKILKVHGFTVHKEEGYLVIHRISAKDADKNSFLERASKPKVETEKF